MKRQVYAWQSLAVLLFLCVSMVGQAQELGQNGVAYVLLSKEFDQHGVYRLNDYDTAANWRANAYKLFNLNIMSGKVSGLSANQQKQVFLLSSTGAGDWQDAPVGWLPTGMKFEDDSPIYLKVMLPNDPEGGVNGYRRDGTPHWSSSSSSGSYWKINQSVGGVSYPYSVSFGGPTEVKYLNGVSGTVGTPIWPGTFSSTTGLAHPTDPRKVILPSHWAGVAYYAYGTTYHPEFPGEALDGTIGRNGNVKPLKLWSAGQAGHEVSPQHIFACIVKRVYKQRTKSLDLYSAKDLAAPPPTIVPTLQSSGMLSSIDVNVTEAYGKYCGDNCIPGGSIGQNSIMTQLSTVTVVTSTKGARYGFNPQGIRKNFTAATAINAALRVVRPGSSVTEPIAISTDEAGTTFAPIIKNAGYLASIGITPSNLKTIGVSSDFSTTSGIDYIYGSDADKFVVQDSWWGRGGIAYEYFHDTGTIRKLDYMANDIPSVQELGVLGGKIDDIAVDGEGYLYVLRTEKQPSDDEMAVMDVDHLNPQLSPNFFEVSPKWLRPPPIEGENSEPTVIADGSQKPGDYKVVTLKQSVFKTLKRYPQGTGSLGAEEPRGQVSAGFDYWKRSIHILPDNSIGWKHVSWSVEEEGDRNSSFPGELAVVNLAKVPDVMPGTSQLNVIVIPAAEPADGQSPDGDFTPNSPEKSVKEHSTLTFKVEGYKPYINGVYHDLKPIGDIVEPTTGLIKHANVKLNATPNSNGKYEHDENGDGISSGFPSSMFESATKKTDFRWSIDLVEDNEIPENPDNLKIIENMVSNQAGTGKFGALSYTFPHPGNYVVRAQVIFNKFDFSGLNASVRPHQLSDSQQTVSTRLFMVKVFSEALNINKSPSYITSISIKPVSRLALDVPTSSVNGAGQVLSMLDFQEDKPLGNIQISFDAQFVRDANRTDNISAALATFDGIGVWDYRYYAQLYKKIPDTFPGMNSYSPPAGIALSDGAEADHVYNYQTGGDLLGITGKIKTGTYNPGRLKGADMRANNGTRVDTEPNDTDWSFIQWGLYLQPTGPYGFATATSALGADARHKRGTLVAKGTCNDSGVTKTLLGDRKYHVTIPVDASKFSEIIKTPKDPETYCLHLEIIYPRVTWLSNDLNDAKTENEKRFSNMVPLFNEDGDKPFHILGRMRLVDGDGSEPGSNVLVNQSWKDGTSGNEFFIDGKESLGIMARDYTLPEFVETPGTNQTPVIQTTGDDVNDVEVSFAVYDNNPHAEIGNFYPAYEMIREDTTARYDSGINNKEFRQGPVITQISVVTGPNDKTFFSNNDWKAGASFTTRLTEYGPGGKFDKGKELQNWIGMLNYTVLGSIRDGIGSSSTIIEHQFYHEKACNDIGLSIPENARINISETLVKAIERIDNDPPSLEVEMVSQVDNRRWVISLNENINDQGPVPDAEDKLGRCTLTATAFNLQSNASIASFTNSNIPGCTNYPTAIGNTDVTVTSYEADAVPQFRRASRLLVNVSINDNTGFRELAFTDIKITNNDGSEVSLLPSNSPAIPLMASLDMNGTVVASLVNRPRASYAIDMPMKALPDQNQVRLELRARDQNGNERALIIPIKVVESTFDTRVLEIKENRN
jgi:hypothetical protein